jgi:hypothetical protein
MKKTLNKLIKPKEVKEALEVLNELDQKFNNQAFKIVRDYVEEMIFEHPKKFRQKMESEKSPRPWICGVIFNVSGDLLEGGDYHLYRGVLNPMGPGNDLLKIYDYCIDELVRIGKIKVEYAEEQKRAVRENIKKVG